jgi:hypothetical protein
LNGIVHDPNNKVSQNLIDSFREKIKSQGGKRPIPLPPPFMNKVYHAISRPIKDVKADNDAQIKYEANHTILTAKEREIFNRWLAPQVVGQGCSCAQFWASRCPEKAPLEAPSVEQGGASQGEAAASSKESRIASFFELRFYHQDGFLVLSKRLFGETIVQYLELIR